MLIWVTGVSGDEPLQLRVLETATGLHGPFATYVVSAAAFAEPSEERLTHTIALIDEMPTAAGRGVMCASAAFLAQALGRPTSQPRSPTAPSLTVQNRPRRGSRPTATRPASTSPAAS